MPAPLPVQTRAGPHPLSTSSSPQRLPLPQVRTLGETVRLDARTKLLNPKWYEGMLSSGYEGVREIQKRLTNTMGWSATSGQVDNWVYDEANSTFIEDPEMAARLMDANPNRCARTRVRLRRGARQPNASALPKCATATATDHQPSPSAHF